MAKKKSNVSKDIKEQMNYDKENYTIETIENLVKVINQNLQQLNYPFNLFVSTKEDLIILEKNYRSTESLIARTEFLYKSYIIGNVVRYLMGINTTLVWCIEKHFPSSKDSEKAKELLLKDREYIRGVESEPENEFDLSYKQLADRGIGMTDSDGYSQSVNICLNFLEDRYLNVDTEVLLTITERILENQRRDERFSATLDRLIKEGKVDITDLDIKRSKMAKITLLSGKYKMDSVPIPDIKDVLPKEIDELKTTAIQFQIATLQEAFYPSGTITGKFNNHLLQNYPDLYNFWLNATHKEKKMYFQMMKDELEFISVVKEWRTEYIRALKQKKFEELFPSNASFVAEVGKMERMKIPLDVAVKNALDGKTADQIMTSEQPEKEKEIIRQSERPLRSERMRDISPSESERPT